MEIRLNQQDLFRITTQYIQPFNPEHLLSFYKPLIAIFVWRDACTFRFILSWRKQISLLSSTHSHQCVCLEIPHSLMPGPLYKILPQILLPLFQHYFCKDRCNSRYPISECTVQQVEKWGFFSEKNTHDHSRYNSKNCL